MSEKKEEGAEDAAEKPKKSKKKLLFIIIGVVVLVAGAGVPMVLMGKQKPAAEEEEHKEEPPKLEVADLGQFIVNLSDASSFLKVHLMMEYDLSVIEKQTKEGGGGGHGGGASGGGGEKKPGALDPHLAARETQLRDAIIRILSSKLSSEMLTLEGKDRLKEELVEGLNEASGMDEPPVTGVYFTEFIVQ